MALFFQNPCLQSGLHKVPSSSALGQGIVAAFPYSYSQFQIRLPNDMKHKSRRGRKGLIYCEKKVRIDFPDEIIWPNIR